VGLLTVIKGEVHHRNAFLGRFKGSGQVLVEGLYLCEKGVFSGHLGTSSLCGITPTIAISDCQKKGKKCQKPPVFPGD
jgi:hypothetical protein